MSKNILLTTTAIIACSVTIYAKVESISNDERVTSVHGSHLRMHDLSDKSSLLDQPVPGTLNPKSTIASKDGLTESMASFLTESVVFVEKAENNQKVGVVIEKTQFDENPSAKLTEFGAGKQLAGFTNDEAVYYAELAGLAYINVANPNLDKEKYDEVERLQAAGNRVQFFGTDYENSGLIITHADGRVTVSYKGSNSLNNFVTDGWANFAIDDVTGLRCHNGIMKGFYRTQDQVFAILEQIAQARGITIEELLDKHVTATGHSLGGGLTEMFMGYAHKKYGVQVNAISFAAPRVFDIADANALDKVYHGRYLNIMQVTDPVPGIALGMVGYKHFGTKLHIPYSTADWQHLMAGYVKALKAMNQVGTLKVGSTTFAYEESNRTGIGNRKTIGNSSVPNPIYPIYQARMWVAENVDPVVHKAAKAVKDSVYTATVQAADVISKTASSVANDIKSTAVKAADSVRNIVTTTVSDVKSVAQKAWSYFWG